jgi:tRNA1Val (adenine37-N6)-methyltransferase
MKVCTDACVFGSWVEYQSSQRILDIGTGTGLLSLMAAQQNPTARIDAIEIDEAAASQAAENCAQSPFADRISVVFNSVQEHSPPYLYDLIITNPPFFQEDLRSPSSQKNRAHHAEYLSFTDLLLSVRRLLKDDGRWAVLLPPDESKVVVNKALGQGWRVVNELTLYHDFTKSPLRRMTTFAFGTERNKITLSSEIAIFESDGTTYTVAFRKLLQEFYLIF